VEKSVSSTVNVVGSVLHQNKWFYCRNNSRWPGLFAAIKFYAENTLNVPDVISARFGKCIRKLPAITGPLYSTAIVWSPGQPYRKFSEHMAVNGKIPDISLSDTGQWENCRVLQIFSTDEPVALADVQVRTQQVLEDHEDRPSSPLSTIPKASVETDISERSATEFLTHTDEKWQQELQRTKELWDDVLENAPADPESGSTLKLSGVKMDITSRS
jgi:hypothetical protein